VLIKAFTTLLQPLQFACQYITLTNIGVYLLNLYTFLEYSPNNWNIVKAGKVVFMTNYVKINAKDFSSRKSIRALTHE